MKTRWMIFFLLAGSQIALAQNCPPSTILDGVELPVVQIRNQCFFYDTTGIFVERALTASIDSTILLDGSAPLTDIEFTPRSASLLNYRYVYTADSTCNPSEQITIGLDMDFDLSARLFGLPVTTTGSITGEIVVTRRYNASVSMDSPAGTTLHLLSTEIADDDIDIDLSNPVLDAVADAIQIFANSFLMDFIRPIFPSISSIFKLNDDVISIDAIISGPSIICGSPLTLSVDPDIFEDYSWSNGSNASSITVNQPGTYSVQITDHCNIADLSVDIATKEIRDFISVNLLCADKTTLSIRPFPSMQWSTGEVSDTIEVTRSGIYGVAVVDEDGCEGSDKVRVNIQEPCFLPLAVSALCSDKPNSTRRWKIHNPNLHVVRVDWEITGTLQKAWIDAPPGDSYLVTNTAKSNTNAIEIYFHDDKGKIQSVEQAGTEEKCPKGSVFASGLNQSVQVFPNPATDQVFISVTSGHEGQAPFQIRSLAGMLWDEGSLQLSPGQNFIYYDVSKFTHGEYLIIVGSETIRFIKK